MSLNKVMLIGNVGQEPTVRYLDTGVCVASVRLATTDRGYTMRDGTQVWKERYRLAVMLTNRESLVRLLRLWSIIWRC